jgi:hypothetical protein
MAKIINAQNSFYVFLVILFLVGIAGIFKFQHSSNQRKAKIVEQIESTMSKPPAEISDIERVLQSERPAKCTFNKQLPNATVLGTIYRASGKLRTDVTAPNKENVEKLSHTIYVDDTLYTWYEGDGVGIKLTRKDFDEHIKAGEKAGMEFGDPNALIQTLATYSTLEEESSSNYARCDFWEEDNFVFVLPPNVKFIDGVKFYEEYSNQLCSKCDEETTEASRLLCRKTLKCI